MMMPIAIRMICCTAVSVFGCTSIFGCVVFAQEVNNETSWYIPEGTEVHVTSVFNRGFIQNQGELVVSGDWMNTNVYQGTGRLTMNGRTRQVLHNNDQRLAKLRINAGSVELQGAVEVDDELDLTAGLVVVRPPHELITSISSSLVGGSRESYIDGALIRVGTGQKFFPIGKQGTYAPVTLLDVSGNIDVMIKMEVLEMDAGIQLEGYHRPISTIIWEQTVRKGSYAGSPAVVGYKLPNPGRSYDVFHNPPDAKEFMAVGNPSITFGGDMDYITTGNAITGQFFLIGQLVNVEPGGAAFYFPTSLSPNATDPNNRSVRVLGESLDEENFQFLVFNRWGLKVFESTSLTEMSTTGWAGQQNAGATLGSGAYPYVLKVQRTSGEVITQKGMITIVK